MRAGPIRGGNKSLRQQVNVEAVFGGSIIHTFFIQGQEINEQSRQTCLIQDFCDIFITRAMTAASAAMRKNNRAFRIGGKQKVALNGVSANWNRNRC